MKKNLKKLAAAAVMTCTLVMGSVSAFAFGGTPDAQMISAFTTEQLNAMTALINTMQAQNLTATVGLSAEIDGVELLNGTVVAQQDHESQYTCFYLESPEGVIDTETYTTQGITITRDGEVYTKTVTPIDPAEEFSEVTATGFASVDDLDMLALFSLITLLQGEGNNVYFNLDDSDTFDFLLAMLMNSFVSGDLDMTELEPLPESVEPEVTEDEVVKTKDIVIGNEGMVIGNFEDDYMQALAGITEVIMDFITIDSLNLTATIENLYYSELVLTSSVTITDEYGEAHIINFICTVNFSDYGSTVPHVIDITDKELITPAE